MSKPTRFRAGLIAIAASMLLPAGSANAQAETVPPAGCTGPASDTWINVVAEGLRSGDGLLALTVYADIPSKFLAKKGSLYVGRVNASAGTTRSCIFLPRTGVYAIVLYHDANANEKFDRTMIGLPAEGFGFTNNPPTIAGLPSFRSVRLNVPRTGLTTRIQMKYP
jgi:uncharacterized protein (DUF2141 family)